MIMINDFGVFYLFTIFFQSSIVCNGIYITQEYFGYVFFALLSRIMGDQWAELVIAGL